MKIEYLSGNVFEHIPNNKKVLIPYICNNKRCDFEGFSKDIIEFYSLDKLPCNDNMGTVTYKSIPGEPIIICGMSATNYISKTAKRSLIYNALCDCMEDITLYCVENHIYDIYCTKFGSGQAGGNWEFIEHIIEDSWIVMGLNVWVCCND